MRGPLGRQKWLDRDQAGHPSILVRHYPLLVECSSVSCRRAVLDVEADLYMSVGHSWLEQDTYSFSSHLWVSCSRLLQSSSYPESTSRRICPWVPQIDLSRTLRFAMDHATVHALNLRDHCDEV